MIEYWHLGVLKPEAQTDISGIMLRAVQEGQTTRPLNHSTHSRDAGMRDQLHPEGLESPSAPPP